MENLFSIIKAKLSEIVARTTYYVVRTAYYVVRTTYFTIVVALTQLRTLHPKAPLYNIIIIVGTVFRQKRHFKHETQSCQQYRHIAT